MYFHILFYLYIFLKNKNNIIKIFFPNELLVGRITPKIFDTFLYSNVEGILSRQQKSIFRATFTISSPTHMVYTIVNRNIQRAPRREKKKSQYFYFGQKRQHFLTNQTMGTTRCGEMQFHAGPSSSGVLFLSHSHVHTIQYIRQHMMCVYYYHKNNICHAQMAMKHHIYIYIYGSSPSS